MINIGSRKEGPIWDLQYPGMMHLKNDQYRILYGICNIRE